MLPLFKPLIFTAVSIFNFFACETDPLKNQYSDELHFRENKTFKIVQFTDLHINADGIKSVAPLHMVKNIISSEQPDLVVFTGDIVTEKPIIRGWDKLLGMVENSNIPYAVVLGNHDDEQDVKRDTIAAYVSKFPHSLMVSKTENVFGNGNYFIRIKGNNDTLTKFILWFFDSNAYSRDTNVKGYDWIDNSQISWYNNESAKLKFENRNIPYPSLAFFHIPLPEYRVAYDNAAFRHTGERKENECSPQFNSGLFDAMIGNGDVFGIFCGHDHDNNYVVNYGGISLGYGRFSGGNNIYHHIERGARVIELSEGQRKFTSWEHLENGEIINRHTFPDEY